MRGRSFPWLSGVALFTWLAIVASPNGARADPVSPEDHERAVRLFVEGRKLLDSGKCAEAIPVLHQSVVVQPSVGARLSLAECFEALAMHADAYNQLRAGEQLADSLGEAQRRDFAHAAVERVEPNVATVRMSLPASGEVEVIIDGAAVPSVDQALLVSRYALVPLVHHFVEVRAPGKHPWRWETSGLRAGGPPVTLPVVLAGEPPVATPGSAREATGAQGAGVGGAVDPRPVIAWIALGVGAAGLVVGAVSGAVALTELASLQGDCQAGGGSYPSRCSRSVSQVGSRNHAILTASTVSTAAFVAGGIAIVAGVTLHLTAPRRQKDAWEIAPTVGATGAGAVLRGGF